MNRWSLLLLALICASGCIHRQVLCPAERCGLPIRNAETHLTALSTVNPPPDPMNRTGAERATDYLQRTLEQIGMTPRRVEDDLLVTLPGSAASASPLLLVGAHGTSALARSRTSCEGTEDSVGVAAIIETVRALHPAAKGTRTVHVVLLGGPAHALEERIQRARNHFPGEIPDTTLVSRSCQSEGEGLEKPGITMIPAPAGDLASRQTPPHLPALVEVLLERARTEPAASR